jgi:6,7-dimethyl-8-ribityllumazine synthase
MSQVIEGDFSVGSERYGIVVSRFNEFITSKLLSGAADALRRHGAGEGQVTTVWVPGAFEVPLAARKMAESGKFAAVICLACVINGATDHYEYVCQHVCRGVGEVQMSTGIPTLFGVITCDTLEQAIERAGSKGGNLGFNAACSAIETVSVLRQLGDVQ